jgi:hypothetical protein
MLLFPYLGRTVTPTFAFLGFAEFAEIPFKVKDRGQFALGFGVSQELSRGRPGLKKRGAKSKLT